VVCLAKYWTRSSIWLISDASEISSSYSNKEKKSPLKLIYNFLQRK
jgi:hypothetical protein